ncbi:MAG TPA: VWA domain-containing protein [Myxococcota bacterium]|nr:VWA domain-containing protein [Myxococcota bacterium]
MSPGVWQTPWLAFLGIDALERPWLGAALLLLAVAAVLWRLHTRPSALAWPALCEAAEAGARGRDPVRVLALGLRTAALSALALSLAGPVSLRRLPVEGGRGLDLVLVVDTSGSMRALDAAIDGDTRTRLDLAREVVARFARTRVADGDRVALVVFGETAFTQCPLTSDARLLEAAALQVKAGMAGEATALGDALALAVKRAMPPNDAGPTDPLRKPVAGRVVVLLTDGRQNAGSLPTDVAAALARAAGVRVHAVGIGSEGAVPMAADDGSGALLHFERHDLDVETLQQIADTTGGRFFRARTPRELEAVYTEIDSLERVARSDPPREERTPSPEPALAAAGAAIVLEIVLARLLGRPLP